MVSFPLSADDLKNTVDFDHRDDPELVGRLNAAGGVAGLATKLRTDVGKGLEGSDLAEREEWFGRNFIEPPPSKTILGLIWDSLHDVILLVLLAGATVTLVIGSIQHPEDGWIEGVAILVAVVIVVGVTVGNDYSKELKFKKLLALQSDKKCKVIRQGHEKQISSWDVLVGDVVSLAMGDEIPADGLFVSGANLVVDESPLTGETIPLKKSTEKPFLFAGCTISEGSGTMLVTTVGERSTGGQIQALLSAAQEVETPLQEKLTKLAVQLGYLGMGAGLLTFVGLTIRWAIDLSTDGRKWEDEDLEDLLDFFVTGVTIVVVAVPEGLPLAVTISLAFSMFKMIRENNFVRTLSASETMGGATTICSDKTGTLTENRMSVVRLFLGGKMHELFTPSTAQELHPKVLSVLIDSMCLNSTAFIQQKEGQTLPSFVGSATEGALLILARKLGFEYEEVRGRGQRFEEQSIPFTSLRKRMATFAESTEGSGEKYRVLVKGAAEIVLGIAEQILTEDGTARPLTAADRKEIGAMITQYAQAGLRAIVMAYRPVDQMVTVTGAEALEAELEKGLVFVALAGIKDPVRADVPHAVKLCQEAGIVVRMVTGDNLLTAQTIAAECGILTHADAVIMEGPKFRALEPEAKRRAALDLRVLARSSPADKYDLVTILRDAGEVVAVTGDGTNDAPALKAADVGFSMGQSGTHVAMNASDIVLLDDNFSSIVHAIRWGRNVFDGIRKFLQFQVAVNVVAIMVTFIGSLAYGESPLSPVQLLWVNLIMDSFGALALATDNPSPTILQRKPHARDEPLITRTMMLYILFHTVYQTTVLCVLLFVGYELFDIKEDFTDPDKSDRMGIYTLLFTTFVLLQVANEVTARHLDLHTPIWHQQWNPMFMIIMVLIIVIQVLVIEFGGDFTETITLTAGQWAGCAVPALAVFPIHEIFKMLVRSSGKPEPGQGTQMKTLEELRKPTTQGTDDDIVPQSVDVLWAKLRAASFVLGGFVARNPGPATLITRRQSEGVHHHSKQPYAQSSGPPPAGMMVDQFGRHVAQL